MAEPVERNRRQTVPVDEFPKPLGQCIRPQRLSVPSGKYKVVILPLIANRQPRFKLGRSVLPQHRNAGCREPDDSCGGMCFGGIYYHPLPRQIGCALPNLEGALFKVEVAPLQGTQFAAAQAGIEQQENSRPVERRLPVKGLDQLCRLCLVQIPGFPGIAPGGLDTATGILRDHLPLYRRLQHGRNEPMVVQHCFPRKRRGVLWNK